MISKRESAGPFSGDHWQHQHQAVQLLVLLLIVSAVAANVGAGSAHNQSVAADATIQVPLSVNGECIHSTCWSTHLPNSMSNSCFDLQGVRLQLSSTLVQ